MHAAAIAIGRELIGADPAHLNTEHGHGRISRWTTWSTGTGQAPSLPGASRLAAIRRDVADLTGQPLSKQIFPTPNRT